MQFSWDLLLNILENDDSNLQTKFRVHITSNIFQNNPILKSQDYTNPPNLPTCSYPTPRGGGRFDFFELKGTQSNFPPWLCVFEHRGENCLGQPPFRELELMIRPTGNVLFR